MDRTYEQVFLAIAVRNKMMSHDAAQACLRRFAENHGRPIEEIAREEGGVTEAQVALLQAGARRFFSGGETVARKRPGGSEAPPACAAEAGATAGRRPADAAEPVPGYRIKAKIGVGGTASIFLAQDRRNGDRAVALKILHPSLAKDPAARERFHRESRLLVEFDHANLIKGYAHGTNGPLDWLAMEFLEGESAQDILDRDKHIPEARALEIILGAAQALDYLQSKGILHRDIKPGNIVVGTGGTVKVCDLGFALSLTAEEGEIEEETTSGTAQYMSPEQARGRRDIDIRADIYSLGATLYHMVMGELPFSGGDSLEVMAKQVMEALNSSEIKNRRISRHMHYFIERMMSKDKSLRYASPRELSEDINEQIEGFKSLEFDEAKGRLESDILKRMSESDPEERDPRRGPITTRRYRKTDRITRRFRRDR